MRLLLKTFCLFLPAFFLVNFSVLAASPLFTVDNVKVDVTAKSAVKAREQAFIQAQSRAFEVLAKRMISEGEIEEFNMPELDIISTLIQDFEIQKEKLSSVRYIATYKFRFKDEDVRRFFNDRGVEYTNVSARPALVLPFYQHQGKALLWSPYNVWKQAWDKAAGLEGLVTFIVPLGDISDVRDVPGDDPLNYDHRKLSRVLKRYDASEAIVMIAVPDQYLAQVTSAQEPVSGSLNIHIYRTDRGYPEYIRPVKIQAASGDTLERMMERGVKDVQRFLRRDWKERTLVNPNQASAIQVRVPIQSLSEWARVQKNLKRVYGISEVKIKSLKPGEAMVELHFEGDIQRLKLALKQANMSLAGEEMPGNPYQATNYGFQTYEAHVIYELRLNDNGSYHPAQIQPFAGEGQRVRHHDGALQSQTQEPDVYINHF